jgi:glucokinase
VTPTAGIDVGGSFVKAVVMEGEEVADRQLLASSGRSVLDAIDAGVEALAGRPVAALGVGLAGLVRWPAGEFVWGPHLPEGPLAVREILARRLPIPVVVDNDANCAALAEVRLGAARGARHMLMVTIGTGIGGGIIAGGSIYRGASFAGEIGHLPMVPDGEPCACGQRGCWETLVSAEVMARRASSIEGVEGEGAEALVAAAAGGDHRAREALREMGIWLARGLAGLVVALDPEVIVVGGGAPAGAGDLLLAPAREELGRIVEGGRHRKPARLVMARFGMWAGAVGAGILAGEQTVAGATRA